MKLFTGLNVWALMAATVLSFLFGGAWYGGLSKPWMKAANLTKEQIDAAGGMSARHIAVTLACQFVMAWMLAGLILHLAKSGIAATWLSGMITAGFLWLGFVLTTLVVNHQYQMARKELTLIDGGHWLGVLLIQGAVLGLYGMAR